jgi:hypothetical protein
VESLGFKVIVLMILQIDNQGVQDLVNNWSVGGQTRHVTTKAIFWRELKEWRFLAIKYTWQANVC